MTKEQIIDSLQEIQTELYEIADELDSLYTRERFDSGLDEAIEELIDDIIIRLYKLYPCW